MHVEKFIESYLQPHTSVCYLQDYEPVLKQFIESSSRFNWGSQEQEVKYLYAEAMSTYPIDNECIQAILALKDYYDTKQTSKTPTVSTTILKAEEVEKSTTPIIGILFLLFVLIGALYGYMKAQKKEQTKVTNEYTYGQELQPLTTSSSSS
jgi:hypothetical protein